MEECNRIMIEKVKRQALQMRKRMLELSFKAGKNGAHLGGSLSAVEILSVLSFLVRRDPHELEKRDRIILSKGHAALALYSMLEKQGILSSAETDTFEANGTHFYAHAKRDILKGIEFSGGSLSLGFSFSVGVALACKSKGYPSRIYVVVGDGECNEGLVWEAAMAAANFGLANLTVIVDCNGLQSDGFTKDIMDSASLATKFSAFGFEAFEVDGHSVEQLWEVLTSEGLSGPRAIIAHTVKGKGIAYMENEKNWHHGVLTQELYEQAMRDLVN